jgi:Flp pilus assembly pilin Flp
MRSIVTQLCHSGTRLSSQAGQLLARPVRGAAMTEYAILVALIAMAAMGAIQAFGGGIAGVFSNLLAHLPAH